MQVTFVQDVESCNLGLHRRGESRAGGGGGRPAAGPRAQRLQRGHLPQLRLRGQQRIQWNMLHFLRFKCDVFGVLKEYYGKWDKGFFDCIPFLDCT